MPKTEKLPSFKDVILRRLWWLNSEGEPLPDKPPLWSLGGRDIDIDAMDYAITCIDGESNLPEMAKIIDSFPDIEKLPKPLVYLRMFYLMMDYVDLHEDEDPTCQWDEDDKDSDISSTFRVMHMVEAAYRMGYVDGKRAVDQVD